MMKFRTLLGVAGINRRENPHAIQWADFFETLLVLVLLWLPIQWYLQNTGKLSFRFLETMDWLIWLLFVSETVVLTFLVRSKERYLRNNWLNLFIIVACFPVFWTYFPYVAFLRYLRVIIILRLTSVQFSYVYRILRRNRFGTTLLAFLIISILGGVFISVVDPSIGPPWEGIWWAFQTVTTVGYGDVVPHTIAGKIFASFFMVIGVGLVTIVTANFVAFLMGSNNKATQKREKEILDYLSALHERLEQLEESNQAIKKAIDNLKSK